MLYNQASIMTLVCYSTHATATHLGIVLQPHKFRILHKLGRQQLLDARLQCCHLACTQICVETCALTCVQYRDMCGHVHRHVCRHVCGHVYGHVYVDRRIDVHVCTHVCRAPQCRAVDKRGAVPIELHGHKHAKDPCVQTHARV